MKVLITGASSGIGRDLAIEFAKLNYEIILVARNVERLEKLQDELIKDYSVKVKYISSDLTSRENCINLFNENPDIDILVNNAGLGDFGLFDTTNLDKDLTIIDTNITALHILTKLYLKEMKKKNQGKILNVASIAGFLPGPLMATYYASKNYVVNLSESIKAELKKEKSNVKISILCPGPVKTNFNNVANVRFDINSLSSEYVAKYTVKKFMKNKFRIIPGFTVKLAIWGAKFMPRNFLANCTYASQKKKEGK